MKFESVMITFALLVAAGFSLHDWDRRTPLQRAFWCVLPAIGWVLLMLRVVPFLWSQP